MGRPSSSGATRMALPLNPWRWRTKTTASLGSNLGKDRFHMTRGRPGGSCRGTARPNRTFGRSIVCANVLLCAPVCAPASCPASRSRSPGQASVFVRSARAGRADAGSVRHDGVRSPHQDCRNHKSPPNTGKIVRNATQQRYPWRANKSKRQCKSHF